MSTVNQKVFPNTSFPDSIQTLTTFEDLDNNDATNYIKYVNALLDGDYVSANNYLSSIDNAKKITASNLNTMIDTISAIQEVYSSSQTFSTLVTQFQTKWQNIINRFSYDNDWVSISDYDSTASYSTAGVQVRYNNKTWRRNNTAGYVAGQVPQEGSAYWTQCYYKNTMVSYEGLLYIAISDINTLDNPLVNSAKTSPQWKLLTIVGQDGEAGDGFNYCGEYSSSTSYSVDNLISYEGKCYSSLEDNNQGHTPNASPDYWQEEFSFNMKQIPITASEPTDQSDGDLWFELITLS